MASRQQRERAQVYRDAAAEHVASLARLYDGGRYVLANYVAGLAVECILRAYRHMIEPEFDARHDLQTLFSAARFDKIVPAGREMEVGVWLTTVVAMWANEHRFLSTEALRSKWKRMRLDRGVKGDFVKERTRQLINAANRLVDLGVARWQTSFAK